MNRSMVICVLLIPFFAAQDTPTKVLVDNPDPMLYEPGTDIQLKCLKTKVRSNYSDYYPKRLFGNHRNPNIIWEFLPCGYGWHKPKCKNARALSELEAEWSTKCDGDIQLCNTQVILNATENDSGLYRCSLQLAFDKVATTVIRVFEIELFGFKKAKNHLPKFLDGEPKDTNTFEGGQVVLRCRVYSIMPLNITWLREINAKDNTNQTHPITYNSKRIINLNSSGVIKTADDIYLSKLIIPNSREVHSGNYVCLAINYKGIEYKEAFVNVSRKVLAQKCEDHVATSFVLLFLIPVALALIPLTIWLCYLKRLKWKAAKCCDNCDNVNGAKDIVNYQEVNRNQTDCGVDVEYKYQQVFSNVQIRAPRHDLR